MTNINTTTQKDKTNTNPPNPIDSPPGKKDRKYWQKQFLQALQDLADPKTGNSGDRAVLKRAAGKTIKEAMKASFVFYRYLPIPLHKDKYEEIFFLVATLRFLNPIEESGNLGVTIAKVKKAFDSESLENRFRNLLQCDYELDKGYSVKPGRFGHQLRHLIKIAWSKEVGVNWSRLLGDLCYWDHPKKFLQKQWARAYFEELDRQNT